MPSVPIIHPATCHSLDMFCPHDPWGPPPAAVVAHKHCKLDARGTLHPSLHLEGWIWTDPLFFAVFPWYQRQHWLKIVVLYMLSNKHWWILFDPLCITIYYEAFIECLVNKCLSRPPHTKHHQSILTIPQTSKVQLSWKFIIGNWWFHHLRSDAGTQLHPTKNPM